MPRTLLLALAANIAAPAELAAQNLSLPIYCAAAAPASGKVPNLHGLWDFLMVPRGQASFGVLSIGFVGADYGGSLMPSLTAPVVLRKVELQDNAIRLIVASSEGDVRFDGKLAAAGNLMCGTVTYHGGETFPMVARKRPSTYQSLPQSERR